MVAEAVEDFEAAGLVGVFAVAGVVVAVVGVMVAECLGCLTLT